MSGRPPGTIDVPPGEFLTRLGGRRVFFEALWGNHGDRLLTIAAEALIERAGIAPVRRARSAELILVNGGGGMADGWSGLDRLAHYCRSFPSVPLAVLPSSFHFTHAGLSEMCNLRGADMWLWARERPSFDVLLREQARGCRFHAGLDHDLAFSLGGHPLIEDLRRVVRPGHLLVVERDDWEGPTGRTRPLAPRGFGFLPGSVRSRVRRVLVAPLRRRQDQRSEFCRAALAYARARHPDLAGLPPVTADISLAESCDFEAFLRTVAGAAVIVTTRLHVAILAHLLEIPTYLVEGRYHKYRGVHVHSMQGGPVSLVTWTGTRIETPSEGGHSGPAADEEQRGNRKNDR